MYLSFPLWRCDCRLHMICRAMKKNLLLLEATSKPVRLGGSVSTPFECLLPTLCIGCFPRRGYEQHITHDEPYLPAAWGYMS